jgi:glutaredoxin-related protein
MNTKTKMITRQALGRKASLGFLYDIAEEKVIKYKKFTFGTDEDKTKITDGNLCCLKDTSLSNLFKIEPEMSLSILSQVFSQNYLTKFICKIDSEESQYKKKISVLLIRSLKLSKRIKLEKNIKIEKKSLLNYSTATHLITGIKRGKVYCILFEYEKQKNSIQKIEQCLLDLKNFLVHTHTRHSDYDKSDFKNQFANLSVHMRLIDLAYEDSVDKMKCEFSTSSIEEILKRIETIDNDVDIEYELTPLEEIEHIQMQNPYYLFGEAQFEKAMNHFREFLKLKDEYYEFKTTKQPKYCNYSDELNNQAQLEIDAGYPALENDLRSIFKTQLISFRRNNSFDESLFQRLEEFCQKIKNYLSSKNEIISKLRYIEHFQSNGITYLDIHDEKIANSDKLVIFCYNAALKSQNESLWKQYFGEFTYLFVNDSRKNIFDYCIYDYDIRKDFDLDPKTIELYEYENGQLTPIKVNPFIHVNSSLKKIENENKPLADSNLPKSSSDRQANHKFENEINIVLLGESGVGKRYSFLILISLYSRKTMLIKII